MKKNRENRENVGEKSPCCFGKQPPNLSLCFENIAPLSEAIGNNPSTTEGATGTSREGGKIPNGQRPALQQYTDSELLAELKRRGYDASKWDDLPIIDKTPYQWPADEWHDEATGWAQ